MISFSVINNENLIESVNTLFKKDGERKRALDFLLDSGLDTDFEYAVSASDGCLLLRVFDAGRYVFIFPYPVSDTFDIAAAIEKIRKYVIKEEIPFFIASFMREDFLYFEKYKSPVFSPMDDDGELYFAHIENECTNLFEIPSESGGRVRLEGLCEADIASYAALCRDKELLKYWGYDYKADFDGKDDAAFFLSQKNGFDEGTSMTLGIKLQKTLIGSLEFYAFDFFGGAEIDVRITPGEQRRGYAYEALTLAHSLAKKIGLLHLYATVMKENAPSNALFLKLLYRLISID